MKKHHRSAQSLAQKKKGQELDRLIFEVASMLDLMRGLIAILKEHEGKP